MDAKLNFVAHKIKVFWWFELFRARLAYKFAKNANMDAKKCSQIFSIWVLKNAEFDANFKSVEKVSRKLHEEG